MTHCTRRALRGSILAACMILVLGATPARAEGTAGRSLGMGLSAFVLTLPWGIAKSFYALGGGVVGGLAWALSGGDANVSGPIFNASMRGDYVVTREHLEGERPWMFVGRSPENQEAQQMYQEEPAF